MGRRYKGYNRMPRTNNTDVNFCGANNNIIDNSFTVPLSKLDRVISLESDLELHPKVNVATVNNGAVKKISRHQDRIVLELNDTLTLTKDNNQKVNIRVNDLCGKIVYKEKPKSVINNVGLVKVNIHQQLSQGSSVNSVDNKTLVNKICAKSPNNKTGTKVIPAILLVKKKPGNVVKSLASKQIPVTSILNVPTITQNVNFKAIKANNFKADKHCLAIHQNKLFLQKKPILIKATVADQNQFATGSVNSPTLQKHQTLMNSKPSEYNKKLLKIFAFKNNNPIVLNIKRKEKVEEVFPVALQQSNSHEIECPSLLNNQPPDESEMQILGI